MSDRYIVTFTRDFKTRFKTFNKTQALSEVIAWLNDREGIISEVAVFQTTEIIIRQQMNQMVYSWDDKSGMIIKQYVKAKNE